MADLSSLDKTQLKEKISTLFTKSIQYDSWGQILEAAESYKQLLILLNKTSDLNIMNSDDKTVLKKLSLCVSSRIATIKGDEDATMSLEDLKKLTPIVETLFVKPNATRFPVNLLMMSPQKISSIDDQMREVEGEEGIEVTKKAKHENLLPAPIGRPNQELLTIFIEKIGLKDAMRYFEPHITISVMDEKGELIEPQQDTGISNDKNPLYIKFEKNVYIQTPINKLPQGAAIFFEFKHYKPKKDKISVRCYTFMEMDEIKNGPISLELYESTFQKC